MSLRLVTIFTFCIFASSAIGNPLDSINREQSICYGKQYSSEHMKDHPTQTVSSILMDLSLQPDESDPTIYLNMMITSKGRRFDAFLICDRAGEKLNCAVECDGGQAEVLTYQTKSDEVLFVNKGFLMSGGCGGQEEQIVRLEPTAGGDDVFRLPRATCN